MKKWSGGSLILVLAIILVLRYSSMETRSQKQSVNDFFNGHSKGGIPSESGNIHMFQPTEKSHHPSKKPDLITFEGLAELYFVTNVSENARPVRVVWTQLHDLLSRSDSLPNTAQGVKEAAIAWRDLVESIEKEKVSRAIVTNSNKSSLEDESCPFSLSALNITSPISETILEFPCGLVQDSSITIVGVPNSSCGSFQFELVGAEYVGKHNLPIILYYNVSLQGDALTESPFIIQNTWTAEYGWGQEERCPAYGYSACQKVDGLFCCNKQIGPSILGDNYNVSNTHLDNNTALNNSKGNAHISVNSPFIDGHPFAATLWVGQEGFHMTVNGRHETSFSFREKLEPWLVNGFRARGGLDVFSVLANGLPVTEDPDLIIDIENMKAPHLSKRRILMLVGVFSTGNNFERRMALRKSWMQYEAVKSGEVAVRFFVGFHKSKQVNVELWKEAQTYGDIQLVPFVDYYSLLTLKTIAICMLGNKFIPAKYIMKTDDDAFVRIDKVLSNLKEKKISSGLLYGLISFDSAPIRDRESKWYISEEEWPHSKYPPWAHGPGYIISRDIAKFVVLSHQQRDVKLFKLEDVAMGIWIDQYRRSGQEVHYISDDRFHNAGCESGYVLAHYQGPRLMLCLWDKLQREKEANCCE